MLAVGDETYSREIVGNGGAMAPTSGQMRFAYFTARKTEVSTQVRLYSGGTAAGATPTLCRIGIYTVNPDGSLTLIAATANDTTLFATANTAYTRSWQTPFNKVAGQRYAVSPLVVTAATMPTFFGEALGALGQMTAEANFDPKLGSTAGSLSDLPASLSAGVLSANAQRLYAVVLP
jgi:hypothetical protein